jgi:hypothetical protein
MSYPPAALEPDADAQTNADRVIAKIVPLGQRFYPSESAFPLREYIFLESLPDTYNLVISL